MIVEFSPQGLEATDVTVLQAAPDPAPFSPPPGLSPTGGAPPRQSPVAAPASPVSPSPQPTIPPRSQPPPTRSGFTVPATPVHRTPTQPSYFVPRIPKAEQSKSTVALLFIFLGPLGQGIAFYYIRALPQQWIATAALVVAGIVFVPIFAFWYIGCLIVGIILLVISQEMWDRQMHYLHDHPIDFFTGFKKEPAYCRTGICRGEGPQDFQSH